MTPEEIERTMEFILQSQANSAVRMDRLEEERKESDKTFQEKSDKLQEQLVVLADVTREHLAASRQLLASVRTLEESDRDMKTRMDGNFALLTRIAEAHSIRLDRLEHDR